MAGSACVFCGSSVGNDAAYRDAAERLGRGMARAGITVVFGGGRVGLMGAVADAALSEGGRVIGVIPEFLKEREVGHAGVTEMITTHSMHARKQRMFDLSDAFVVLPGGTGTLDETVEMLTWRQLHRHTKPILLLNVGGYWDPLLAFFEAAQRAGFVHTPISRFCDVVADVDTVLDRLRAPTGAATGSSRGL